jgi:Leucine-rich repeat (LRR) protein
MQELAPLAITRLVLDHNLLRKLPDVVLNLRCLAVLQAAGNSITHLPDGLDRLQTLQALMVSENQVQQTDHVSRGLAVILACHTPVCGVRMLRWHWMVVKVVAQKKHNAVMMLCYWLSWGLFAVGWSIRSRHKACSEDLSLLLLVMLLAQLHQLPESISGLSKLRALSVASNRLWQVPAGICYCSALKLLDCSHNQLGRLPQGISQLSNLRSLKLSHNRWGPCTQCGK